MRPEIEKIVSLLLWETGAIKISLKNPFRLTSGNYSPLYINCRVLISHQAAREIVTGCACWLYETENLQADYIAGGETAGIPFAAWLAEKTALPLIYLRKQPKGHGLFSQIEGQVKTGSTVLLYEDLITDGGSKLRFFEAIKRANCRIDKCLVVFDREQGGRELLQQEKVTLFSLTNLSSCLKAGLEKDYFSHKELVLINEYLVNPQLWHQKRGYSFVK